MAKRKAARKGARRSGGSTSRRASTRRQTSAPGAIRLLKQDHQEVSKLLGRYEKASGGSKVQIAQRICAALSVHAQIEEELLYPAARRALKEDDRALVAEANVEHSTIKDLVGQIEAARGSDELYDAKVKVLGEYVKHHVKEEETELFPKLQKTSLDLDALGGQLAARKAELSGSMGMQGEGAEEDDSDVDAAAPRGRSRGSRAPASTRMKG